MFSFRRLTRLVYMGLKMKKFDFISLVLVAPIMPLFMVLEESQGIPNPKANLTIGLYGYLVFCGVLFNLGVIIAFLMEITK